MLRLLREPGPSSCQPSLERVAYCKGALVFQQAQPRKNVYQVIAGAVRTHKLLPDGRRQIAGFHFAGDIFGLEIGETHRFTAEAIVPTTLRLASRSTVDDVVETRPMAFRVFLGMITDSLVHAENQMLLLGRQNSHERVAAFLVEMHSRSTEQGVTHIPMSRRDIADYLGLTIETVSRAMSEFQKSGFLRYVDKRRRDVIVVDKEALVELADERR
jgi:CRP/FNR family nitrogen fixation transcriptional regulator